MIRKLDEHASVATQIAPDDLSDIAARGFVRVVNNRSDGEEPGQPEGEAIRDAAERAGLDYVAIPIAGDFGMADVDAMAAALEADGPVLAFCRSGTRSTNLWALARARAGDDADAVIEKAGAAGYDLSGLRAVLDNLRPSR